MKKGFTLIELLVVIAIMGILGGLITSFRGCKQSVVKNFGGSMTVELEPNKKLVNATWKDNNLWVLVTERTNESPKVYNFTEKSAMGVLQGNVTIIEK